MRESWAKTGFKGFSGFSLFAYCEVNTCEKLLEIEYYLVELAEKAQAVHTDDESN